MDRWGTVMVWASPNAALGLEETVAGELGIGSRMLVYFSVFSGGSVDIRRRSRSAAERTNFARLVGRVGCHL